MKRNSKKNSIKLNTRKDSRFWGRNLEKNVPKKQEYTVALIKEVVLEKDTKPHAKIWINDIRQCKTIWKRNQA